MVKRELTGWDSTLENIKICFQQRHQKELYHFQSAYNLVNANTLAQTWLLCESFSIYGLYFFGNAMVYITSIMKSYSILKTTE